MATTKPPFSHLGPMPALFYIGFIFIFILIFSLFFNLI